MISVLSFQKVATRVGLILAGCSVVGVDFAFADTDHLVRYLHLQNNGNYTISDIELNWVTPEGKSKSNKFTADLLKSRGFCLDLEQFGDVPDGSEVWLKAYIALGDTESCRKDNPRIYQAGLPAKSYTYTQRYKMGGQTATNNMCKLTSGTEGSTESSNNIGNSKDCPYR